MKIIRVEEHYEPARTAQAMQQLAGKAVAPNLSKDMLNYMHTSLPTLNKFSI
ncbi:hypothetical protein [Loigolactobacillus zhaoyuanensis]|uniref:Uncharacterized protein n=1 Tax=Loigolactobacillus zhaoyuanensis TaxID=2486017 RepID=A0ABW8U8Q1_9LACO|nr:hypothetical protein [Loigolactobacillus zhaoyuanensis]